MPEPAPNNFDTEKFNATRQKLMEAAIICATQQGVAKTTLNDIARTANCARQTVYNHFKNKDEVIYAALQQAGDRFANALLAHIQRFDNVEQRILEGMIFCIVTLPSDPALWLVGDPSFSPWINAEAFQSTTGLSIMRDCTEACLFGNPTLLPYRDEIAETITRIVLSMVMTQHSLPRDEPALRDYLRRRFLPGLLATHC